MSFTSTLPDVHNPIEPFLRMDRMPHIWCPGCGIGTTVNCFTRALIESQADLKRVAIVSGIGCTGRVAGYVNLDSFHTTHGRAIPFATGLKLANPSLDVVVYSGDGDLTAIGGNHLIHAARRNINIKVICVNNLIYAMTGGQTAPTTPSRATTSTAPYGTFEPAFNLVQLADSAGASYVARWTTFHVKQLARSMGEAMKKKGFSFIEVISPCPTLYQRRNKMGDGLDAMKYYKEKSKTRHGAPTSETALSRDGEIVVGKFVDRDRPDYLELLRGQMTESLGRQVSGRGGVRMQLTEIRIAGFGGQGVILLATVIGKAASIYQGAYATMTQSFGPEARGGAASAQVILSDTPILYPYVTAPDILVAMSQEAYTRFAPELKPGGILILEQELVRVSGLRAGIRAFGVPATRLAEELGRKMVLNVVMVGFFGAVAGILEPDALRQAVADSVPPSTQKLNLQAFEKGFEHGTSVLRILKQNGEMHPDGVLLESEA